jgi:hypothetical protein
MQNREKQIPIWFFVGALLALYGALVSCGGLYEWLHPPPAADRVKLWNYHAAVWWGLMLIAGGLIYVVKFWPAGSETLTGKDKPERPPHGSAP